MSAIIPSRQSFIDWGASVRARGGVVTVVPKGVNQGAYAARFPAAAGLAPSSYRWELAPYPVLLWQFGQLAKEEYEKRAGAFASDVLAIGGTVARGAQAVVSTTVKTLWPLLALVAAVGFLIYGPSIRRQDWGDE